MPSSPGPGTQLMREGAGNAGRCRPVCASVPRVCHNGTIGNSGRTEYSLAALNLFPRSYCLFQVVREFCRRVAVRIVEFAHQIERVKAEVSARIAIAEIIGEQRAPSRTEADTSPGGPFPLIAKITGLAKLRWRGVQD